MRTSKWLALGALAAGAAAWNGCAKEPVADGFPGSGPEPSFDGGSSSGSGSSSGPQPSFGATVTATVPPPPISGGTLLVMHDGRTAIAADPDRDAVYVVDVSAGTLLRTVSLQAGDEPGRVAEDGAGRVHVALRAAGALVTIDPAAGTILTRRTACPAPRGVAWDATRDVVWVACATGELVALPSAGGAATTSFHVQRDLRDVVVQDGELSVTTFRTASLLRIASDGTVSRRDALPAIDHETQPQVAWRAVAATGGSIVISHQEHSTGSLSTAVQGGYGGQEGPPAIAAVITAVAPTGAGMMTPVSLAVLPVDVAVSPDGQSYAMVAAGNAFDELPDLVRGRFSDPDPTSSEMVDPRAQLVAVAFDAAGDVVVQSREPARLYVVHAPGTPPTTVTLATTTRADTGHDVFHTGAGAMIACASCHPEGGDDGHVWLLDGDERRTPSLRGTIAGTAPYHWPGDEADFVALADDVYTKRMSGAQLTDSQLTALRSWVERIPAPPPPAWVDAAAAQRGRALFERADVGCSTCHVGAKLTNNATLDVGTGGRFQVPPLVGVGWRTPLLHGGCASTMADRFGPCATPQHGSTSGLSAADVSDLVAYLETL
jgi:hypothetical protein